MDCARIFAPLFAMALCAAAFGNDGWYSESGAPQGFGQHQHVKLVSENLHIDLGNGYSRVNVLFTFKNHGPTANVTMGFPEESSWSHGKLKRFRSWVDGQPISVRRKALEVEDGMDLYKAVWLKTVPFKRGQIRRVRVSYLAQNGGSNTNDEAFRYVLRTAATWKGPIRDLKITVDSGGLKGMSAPQLWFQTQRADESWHLSNRAWRTSGKNRRTIRFRDVEPDFNLQAEMIPGFWAFRLNGIPVEQRLAKLGVGRPAPFLNGNHVYVPVAGLGDLFGKPVDDSVQPWGRTRFFRHFEAFTVKEPRLLVSDFGQQVKLRNPAVRRRYSVFGDDHTADFVRLEDVVRSLGGKYSFDRRTGIAHMSL